MSYYFWLGRDSDDIDLRHERHQQSRDYMQSLYEAYGYEEPQAGAEALNLTDSNSTSGVREPLAVEADGFITVHPKLNRPLNR